jgi:hypothetical protein
MKLRNSTVAFIALAVTIPGKSIVDAFVPQVHYYEQRYQQRIANTQLHYVKVDADAVELEDVMDMTALVRDGLRRNSEPSRTDKRSHFTDDDDEDEQFPTSSSSVHLMASFVVSQLSSTTKVVDHIKVLRAAGILVPEIFTVPLAPQWSSALQFGMKMSGKQSMVDIQKEAPLWNRSSLEVTNNVAESSTVKPSATPMNQADSAVPFFATRVSRPVPFFAKVETTIPSAKPVSHDVMTTVGEKTSCWGWGLPTPGPKTVNPVVLEWPTVLTPQATAQEALNHVQDAFGAMFSTSVSSMVRSVSNLARDYYAANNAKAIITLPQLSLFELPEEWNHAWDDAKNTCGALVSTAAASVLDSMSKKGSSESILMPHPPQSIPGLALLGVAQDEEETKSPKTEELDLADIDNVLMEAEWALRVAEAAFQ